MSTPDVLREIRRATRPYGVAAAHELEISDRQRRYACQTGVLTQPYPGVCIDPAAPATPYRDLQAAVFAARALAGAWGLSAAWLWSLIDEPPCGPRIVVPIDRYVRLRGVFVRRATDLCPAHLMRWKHIPVTKPLITAIDLGAELSAMDLAEVYVRARQRRLFEPAAVKATLARIARRGRDGVSTSRDALELVMIGDRPADSVLELRFHHGPGQLLPPYEYQHTVVVDGKKYRIDFA